MLNKFWLLGLILVAVAQAQMTSYDPLTSIRTNASGGPLWAAENDLVGLWDQAASLSTTAGKNAILFHGSQLDDSDVFTISSISSASNAVVTITQPTSLWIAGLQLSFPDVVISGCSFPATATITSVVSTTQYAINFNSSACSGFVSGTVHVLCAGGIVAQCGLYWQFHPYPYDAPSGYMPYWKVGSAWDSNTNRLIFTHKCDVDVPSSNPAASELSPGTLSRYVSKVSSNNAGPEAYTNINLHVRPGRPYKIISSDQTDYTNDNSASVTPIRNFLESKFGESWFTDTNRFYLAYQVVMKKASCYLYDVQTGYVGHEPDEYVFALSGTYSGPFSGYTHGRYELAWNGQKTTKVKYHVRYSTSDIKSIGWSNATDGGYVEGTRTTFAAVNWNGSDIAEASTMYLGIRPEIPIAKLFTHGGEIAVELAAGRDAVETGDHVVISGAPGGQCAEANGSWTVTKIPRKQWWFIGDVSSNIMSTLVVTGAPTTPVTTATLANPYTIVDGQEIFVWRPDTTVVGPWQGIGTQTGASTFTFASVAGTVANGSYDNTSGTYPANWSMATSVIYTLDGSSGCTGTFANTGGDGVATFTSTEENVGFSQISLDKEGISGTAFSGNVKLSGNVK